MRRKVQALDRVALGEASRLFAISRNVASRVEASTGLTAEVLPHPPQALEYRCENYGDFVLSVNRLDRAKRIDLLIEAAARDGSLEVVIAGEGPDRERLERLAHDRGLERPCALHGPDPRDASSPICTRAASPSTTRRWTRTTAWCRSRRSSPRSRC